MKNKKIYITMLFCFILILMVGFIAFMSKAYSASTAYRDWSEIDKINENYSYSTLFMSENTKIKVIKEAGTNENLSLFYRSYLYPGNELIILITECATNKDGELLDVVIKINNIKKFSNVSSGYVGFEVGGEYEIARSQNNPSVYDSYTQKVNQPLVFIFHAHYAQANYTMTYYKSGTYKSESEKGEVSNINSVSGIYWDFDIENNDSDNNGELFNGDEGMKPITGNSIIYYNKNKKHGSYSHTLKEQSDGIAISSRDSSNTNTIYYESSAFITTSGLSNATYSFTYSGRACGIYYMFASPYPFEIDAPTKSINKTSATTGEKFIYTVSQYVPNNYYGTLFSFHEIYSQLYKTSRFNSMVIKDTIDNHLAIDTANIKVINEANVDVTKYFTIGVSGNNVAASATAAALSNVDFYAHTYKLQVPVTVKEDTYDIEKITNKATTTSSICKDDNDCPTENKDTSTVDIKLRYNLTVNYIEGSTKNVIAPQDVSEATYYYNDGYKTNYDKIDLKMWRIDKSEVEVGEGNEVDKDTKIIEGNIKGNTIVNYIFEKREYPVTVNYYDAQTKEKIAESDKTIYYYTMNYYTNYDKIDSDMWEYVSTDGDAIEGVIDGEQDSYTVNYYFNRLKYRLLVNYFDDKTKAKIAKGDRYTYNYRDEYNTNYDKIDKEYWEYVRTEGETPGTIYEDTEVDYYFKTSEYRILVNYYDKDTGEKIDESEVMSKKYGEEYTTNDDKIDKKNWEIVEEPKNAKGIAEKDTEVNYYYKRREYKIVIHYYEDGTNNEITDPNESIAHYGDKYVTDYNKVDGSVWKLVRMPDNYQGEVTGDIEVNYYFKKIKGTSSSQPGINNPQTGPSQNNGIIIEITVMISLLLIIIISIYKIYLKRKIYKL